MDVLGPLIRPALQLSITALFRKVRRLKSSYDAAFADDRAILKVVELALTDIKTVFGRAGYLTKSLNDLLDEISRTGLLDQLCLAALTGENITRTRLLFSIQANNHYSVSKGESPDLTKLFDQFVRIIHTSAQRSNIDVRALRDDLVTKRKLQAAGVFRGNGEFHSIQEPDGLTDSVERAYTTLPWLRVSSGDCSKFIQATASAMADRFSDITVEGPSNRQIRLPHQRIYVEPTLVPEPGGGLTINATPATGHNPPATSLITLLQDYSQLTILGDPGGGKTTIARIHCHQICQLAKQAGDFLPIFLTIRHYEAATNAAPQLSLIQFVLNEVARQSNSQLSLISDRLQYALLFGRCFIIFDGLDEIIDIGRRRDFVTTVLQFMNGYPLNRFIITSRIVGYREAPLRSQPTYFLSKFGTGEIMKYATLSARNVFNVREDIIYLEVRRFLEESNRSAKEFLGSPLLLSLIIWLFFSTQRIPYGRLNIYRECAELMFQRWDALRGIHPDVPSPYRLFALLVYLAPSFYLDSALQAGASRAWLRDAVKRFFEEDLSNNASERALEAATKFTQHLIGRAWVLHEVGADRFEFAHRTFLEFFFARYLSEKHETIDGLLKEIGPRIAKSEWVLPAHLALEMKIDGSKSRAARVSDKLKALSSGKGKGGITPAARTIGLTVFIADATRYLQPNEQRLEEIAELVILRGVSGTSGTSLIYNVLRSPNEMRDSVYRGIASGAVKLLEQEEWERFGIVVDWFRANKYINKVRVGQVRYLPGALRASTESIVKDVGNRVLLIQSGDGGLQKIAFDLSENFERSFTSIPSARIWYESSSLPYRRLDWRFIDAVCILKELWDLSRSGGAGARSFVLLGAAIGDFLLGRPAVFAPGRPTVLDRLEPDLLSFVSSTSFDSRQNRLAALTGLLVAREAVRAHANREVVQELNFGLVRALERFLSNHSKMMGISTSEMIRGYIDGRIRVFSDVTPIDIDVTPIDIVTPQQLLGSAYQSFMSNDQLGEPLFDPLESY